MTFVRYEWPATTQVYNCRFLFISPFSPWGISWVGVYIVFVATSLSVAHIQNAVQPSANLLLNYDALAYLHLSKIRICTWYLFSFHFNGSTLCNTFVYPAAPRSQHASMSLLCAQFFLIKWTAFHFEINTISRNDETKRGSLSASSSICKTFFSSKNKMWNFIPCSFVTRMLKNVRCSHACRRSECRSIIGSRHQGQAICVCTPCAYSWRLNSNQNQIFRAEKWNKIEKRANERTDCYRQRWRWQTNERKCKEFDDVKNHTWTKNAKEKRRYFSRIWSAVGSGPWPWNRVRSEHMTKAHVRWILITKLLTLIRARISFLPLQHWYG